MPEIFPIVLNSTNAVPGDSSTYIYKFPRGSVKFKNASIALSQIHLYYSWANIDKALYNNSEFRITFPANVPGGFTSYSFTIPDGNYEISDINAFLQSQFITNGLYLRNDSTGQNRYFMELITNARTYKVQLICYPVPTSLPSGFSNPGNMSFPIAADQQPALIVESTNNFGLLLGFNAGTWFDHESDFTPQISPVSSCLVTCSLVNNKFTNPNNIIYSFVSAGTDYGRMLNVTSQELVFANIDDGLYTQLSIKFLDNSFRRLNIKDTNLIIYLIVKID